HHVAGQSLGQCGADGGGVGDSGECFGDVADQPLVAGAVFAGDDGGVLDAVECGQGGLDFAEFDAVAADLDLFVGAAEILQLSVGAQRTRSPVRYIRAPGPPNGQATN